MKKDYVEPNVQIVGLVEQDVLLVSTTEGIARDEWDAIGDRLFY